MKVFSNIIKFILSLFKKEPPQMAGFNNVSTDTPVSIPSVWIPSDTPLQGPTSLTTSSSSIIKPTVTITRQKSDNVETLGSLTAIHNGKSFTCNTLELAWKSNQHDISSIPSGTYLCSIRPFHDTQMYEVLYVPNRTAVFIHPGNFYNDTKGCILLGQNYADLNNDSHFDVTSSNATIKSFMKFMGGKDFLLIIE